MLYDCVYMTRPGQADPGRQKVDWWLSRAKVGVWEETGSNRLLMGMGFPFGVMTRSKIGRGEVM